MLATKKIKQRKANMQNISSTLVGRIITCLDKVLKVTLCYNIINWLYTSQVLLPYFYEILQ